ncbi:MAG: hypothetical protein WBX25_21725, partial [Rhodomicrobium sp.]
MENNFDAPSKTQLRPLPWNKGKLIGPKPPLRPSCLVPLCDGISLTDPKLRERLWDRNFTAAPRQRTPSERQYSDR